MENQLLSFPALTSLFFILLVLKLWSKLKNKNSNNLPPGPKKLPVIGNIHQLIGFPPHQILRDLAMKYGSVMHLQLGETSNVIISSPDAAKQVMKTHDVVFAQRPFLLAASIITYNFTDIAFSPYTDYWRQLRKICTLELLSAKRVQSYRSIREEEVSNFIRTISSFSGKSFNFSRKLFSLTYGIAGRASFGKKCKDQEEFIPLAEEITEAAGGFGLADLFPSVKLLHVISGTRSKLMRLRKDADRIFENIINDHRSRKKELKEGMEREEENLLDVLLRLQDHGNLEFPLTNDNIKAIILDIFIAGSETSSTTVEWAMSEMLKNPKTMQRAQEQVRRVYSKKESVDESELERLKYLQLVIKETLRLHPPAPLLLPRESRETIEINGYEIPEKTKVIVNAWAIGRDPNHWHKPEKFKPERFVDHSIDFKGNNFEFIPFGAGRRMCPGMTFGIANVELPLAQLLYHFDWKLPDGMKPEELDMVEGFGATMRRKNDLHLIPIPRYKLPRALSYLFHHITKMDFQIFQNSYLPIFISFLVFIFTVFIISRRRKSKTHPPGPWKLPIIGNLHNLLGSLPHHSLYKLSQKHGPIMHLKLGEINTIVISSPETAKQALKTHDLTFANRPFSLSANIISYESSNLVFAPYGEYWRQLRKICMLELLSSKRVQSFRSIREEEVLNIMKLFSGSEGCPINFSTIVFKYMYSVISRAAFGKVRKEQEGFVPHVKEIVELGAGFSVADVFPSVKLLQNVGGMKSKLEKLHHEADKILESIVSGHKSRKGKIGEDDEQEDLVDVLLKFQDDPNLEFSLTTDNIKAVILDVFIAGSETSSTTVEWTMAEMLKNPSVMEKAQSEVRQVFKDKGYVDETKLGELNYLKLVIKEALRLHPPLPLLLPRESQDECEINGYYIPKKTKVFVNAWAIGRDPKYWNEAEKFNPERFCDSSIDYKGGNFELIPFGSGRRVCPGITFGIVNVEFPLANLLYHFDWKLPDGMRPEELDMNEGNGVSVKRETDLNLIPIMRHSLRIA
ncbi:cytochrome P450 family 71 subfamily B polypeptide 34 [Euphorbia peplus]|nr:cytochrome P450 family 71 subfamily B polypeptide 34 [Euphorbia peplus]